MMMMMELAKATAHVDVYIVASNNTGVGGPAPPRRPAPRRDAAGAPQPDRPQSPTQRHFGMANLAGYPGDQRAEWLCARPAARPTRRSYAQPFRELEIIALAKAYQDAAGFHLRKPTKLDQRHDDAGAVRARTGRTIVQPAPYAVECLSTEPTRSSDVGFTPYSLRVARDVRRRSRRASNHSSISAKSSLFLRTSLIGICRYVDRLAHGLCPASRRPAASSAASPAISSSRFLNAPRRESQRAVLADVLDRNHLQPVVGCERAETSLSPFRNHGLGRFSMKNTGRMIA